MLFVYGRILSQQLVNTVTTDKVLYKLVSKLVKYHMIACYALYIAGAYQMFRITWTVAMAVLYCIYACVDDLM